DGHRAVLPGIQSLGDTAYGAPFACGVMSFEDQHELLLPKGLTVCQAREAALPMRQLFFVVVLVQGRGIVDLGKRAFVSIERRRRRAWDGFLSRGRRTAQGTEYFLTRANAAHTFVGAWNHLPGSEAE